MVLSAASFHAALQERLPRGIPSCEWRRQLAGVVHAPIGTGAFSEVDIHINESSIDKSSIIEVRAVEPS